MEFNTLGAVQNESTLLGLCRRQIAEGPKHIGVLNNARTSFCISNEKR